jgi:hypothetical protein
MMNKANDGWILTYTGRKVYPLKPDHSVIDILDIAHHLALQCRFAGAVSSFYSVAQHSVLVSRNVPGYLALVGLLHDAAEAYMQDLVRPVKQLIPRYAKIEQAWLEMIDLEFCLKGKLARMPLAVLAADEAVLATEQRDLLRAFDAWAVRAVPLTKPIRPWTWQHAERSFLNRYDDLTQETKV